MSDDALDSFIEELLDVARENPIDDARIIIRDRLMKDIQRVIEESTTERTVAQVRVRR